jgi:hypothetical protein
VKVEGRTWRPDREGLTSEIADLLGIPRPPIGKGSTVAGPDLIHPALVAVGVDPAELKNNYRRFERLLDHFGAEYDPRSDSSEHRGRTGGETITNDGFKKLFSAISGKRRCFILNWADNPESVQYEDIPGKKYGFDDSVTGRNPFLHGGPGSRVVIYRTKNASSNPMSFDAAATVLDMFSEGANHNAVLAEQAEFPYPVPFRDVHIEGWNVQHSIVEITYETYVALLRAGGLEFDGVADLGTAAGMGAPSGEGFTSPHPDEKSGDSPKVQDLPPIDDPVDTTGRAGPIPDELPGTLEAPDLERRSAPDPDRTERWFGRTGRTNVSRNKRIEERAVFLATEHLVSVEGWTLTRDCQKDGCGYDFEFEKDGRIIHAEVKGIGKSSLAFNLTDYEWARVLNDPLFLVVAVTDVLDDDCFEIHFLRRDQITGAQARATQYRVSFDNLALTAKLTAKSVD